jgi:hypothetical protein
VVRHAVPAGVDTAAVRANRVSAVDYFGEHLGKDLDVSLIRAAGNTLVTPAAASAALNTEIYPTSRTARTATDFTGAEEWRLVAFVGATGNAAGAGYKLSWRTTDIATWSGGTDGPIVILGSNGGAANNFHRGAWEAIPSGAQADIFTALLVGGVAIGTTPPTIGSLSLQVR